MKRLILLFFIVVSYTYANAQCTTTNATNCRCKDSTQTDCDLLPDIEIGRPPFQLLGQQYGVIEYSQTGNGVDNGRLKVTVSTPNTGFGPLEIHTTNVFVCGTDTFVGSAPSICPDGVSYPRIVINQRIFHKNGNTMTYWDRFAGTMTYHPSHGHMHVDNWGNYTLRVRDSTQADPLLWPLIGAGTKLAFCVEDYGTCAQWPDHCLDSNGVSLNSNSDFPNYGLGGGGYNCSSVVQGITSGYVDVYWTSLDGMWIDLPKGLCNGTYWIVTEVDPNHNFLEESETNNVYAVPFVVTQQVDSLNQVPMQLTIANSITEICPGESVTLTANNAMPGNTYMWNNGATTKSINVTQAGTYSVTVNSTCGSATSDAITFTTTSPPPPPAVTNDTILNAGSALLNATSSYQVMWFDQPSGGIALDTGYLFNTPVINNSTTFYAQTVETHPGTPYSLGLADSIVGGIGGYYNGDQSEIFDCFNTFVLHTVKVYSPSAQNITVDLSRGGTVLQTVTVPVIAGPNVITLDMLIQPGTDYYITRNGSEDLYRNNPGTSNIGYPFQIGNFCSIKTSSAGDEYYYFFYDWTITTPDHSCTSGRIPVQAVVLNPTSASTVDVLSSLSVYPNPASSSLTVSFNTNDKISKIELVNELGQVSMRRNVISTNGIVKEMLNISELSRGLYNVRIISNGKNYYQKIVIN